MRLATVSGLSVFCLCLCAAATPARAQGNPVERFDLSGLPPTPTTFLEQQIRDLVQHHRAGDLLDARIIQRKLATYYFQRGDSTRGRAADALATRPDPVTAPKRPAAFTPAPPKPTATSRTSHELPATQAGVPNAPPASPGVERPAGRTISGQYVGYVSGVLNDIQLSSNGTYTYRTMGAGAATVRNVEQGLYGIAGGYLVAQPTKQAGGFVTGGTGGSQVGGGMSAGGPQWRMRITLIDGGKRGIVLEGVTFKPK